MTFTKTTFDTVTMLPRWSPAEANKVGTELEYLDGAVYNPNLLINGNFDVWQRGTSFANTGLANTCTADRWNAQWSHNCTVARSTDVPDTLSKYSLYASGTFDNATPSTEACYLAQRIEGFEASKLSGKTVTLSFYAKGSMPVPASGRFAMMIQYPSALDNFQIAASTLTNVSFTLNADWTYNTTTFVLPATTGGNPITNGMAVYIYILNGGVGAYTLYIAQVKLELGDTATAFIPRLYAQELLECQRYFIRQYPGSSPWGIFIVGGGIPLATLARFTLPTPVQMRTLPTITHNGLVCINQYGGAINVTAWETYVNHPGCLTFGAYVAGGLTIGRGCELAANADATAYINYDAEL